MSRRSFPSIGLQTGVAILLALAAPIAAHAEFKSYDFDIPAQDLASALKLFAKQGHQQVMFDGALLQGRTSTPLKGAYTPAEAIHRLLSGAGVSVRVGAHGEFQVVAGGPQPAAASPAETPETSTTVEDVIVTAQKRDERLIETPQSVTALSSASLARMGALQFRDFASTVPGLTFATAGAGQTQISLRGVTTGTQNNPTVAVYVDDVPYGSSSAFAYGARLALDVGLFDVDRVEVLRGPQGTLYGASAMGGLIKYVSKRPDETAFGGDAQAGLSGAQDGGANYNAALSINVPVVADKAALRVSGFESHDGGYIDNLALGRKDVNRSDVYGARLDLLLNPTDKLAIRLGGFLQDISRDGQGTADYTLAGAPVDGDLDQSRPFAEPFDQHFRLVSGVVTYDFGPASLTSISSYQTTRTKVSYDVSAVYAPLLSLFGIGDFSAVGLPLDISTRKFTQEVRLSSDETGPIQWLAGAFYTRESSGDDEAFALRDLAGRPVPNTLYTVSAPTLFREYAAFGDLTYKLSDKLDVSGGVRYAHNDQVFSQTGSGLLVGSEPTQRSHGDVFTYLANGRYHFSDHATGYIRFATGYRPGGPNYVGNDPATGLPLGPRTFEADQLKSYEAGFKAETPDRRFGVDLAAYFIDWTNIQVLTSRSGFGVIVNAPGGATVRGAELTATARPADGVDLTAAFAYQDAHLSQADADLGAAKGERLPEVPRFTAALSADYRLAEAGGLWPRVGGSLRYVSDRMASFDGSASAPQYRLPGYVAVDLRTGVTIRSVDLQVFVHNLFDTRGQLSAFTSYAILGGPAQVSILQPRTIGVSASTSF